MRKPARPSARVGNSDQLGTGRSSRLVRLWAVSSLRRQPRLGGGFGVEVLESRTLLSNVSLVGDINSVDLYPQNLTPVGTTLFSTIFGGGNSGTRLAVTTATGSTTVLSVTGLTDPASLTAAGNNLYFIVGGNLWTSDGTTAGTEQISFSDPIDASSTTVSDLTAVGSTLFFLSSGPSSGNYGDDLWSLASGSTAPVLVASNLTPGDGDRTAVTNLTAVGNVLYFTVSASSSPSAELWQSNGTSGQAGPVTYVDATTQQTTDITSVLKILNFNGSLYYVATDASTGGTDLDTYDLITVPQTVYSFSSTTNQPEIENATVVGTDLFFSALVNNANERQLWMTTGTNAGTLQLTTLNSGSVGAAPANLTDVDGTLYFTATGANNQNQLWLSNGTVQGTSLVTDLTTPPVTGTGTYGQEYSSGLSTALTPPGLAALGGTLYFASGDPTHGTELWSTSATEAPALVDDIDPGLASSAPHDLVNWSGEVCFVAHDGSSPQMSQIWATNSATTNTVASFWPAYTAGSLTSNTPAATATIGNTFIFVANDGVDGPAVWASDGTGAGTLLLAPVNPTSLVNFTNALGDQEAYFVGDSESGPALWETNGTQAGTTVVQSLPSVPANAYDYTSGQYDLTLADGQLFFTSSDGKGGQDLWASDGTAAGTAIVKDVIGTSTYSGSSTYYSLDVSNLTAAAGKLFFTAYDPNGGTDLWVSGGTPGSTIVLDDFDSSSTSGYYSSDITNLTAAAGKLFFTASSGSDGPQPWVSDGTTIGTVMLADVDPGSAGSAPSEFTQLGGEVYFLMNESSTTVGLWESDGTTAGTAKVFDAFAPLTVGARGYTPTLANLSAIGAALFFSLEYNTTTPQCQLWTSDGTTSGTSQVNPSSLPSGSTFSEMQNFLPLGSLLVFSADDGTGAQLWKSDGTADGTTVIADNGPTIGNYSYNDSYDAYQTIVNNGVLYFVGNTLDANVELWETDGTASGTQMVTDFSPATYASDPLPLAVVNNQLLFYANDGIRGEELWSFPVPQDPSITPIPAQMAVVNQELSVQVQASEPGNPSATLDYSLIDSPPQGASMNASGLFTWTPTQAETPGGFELTVQVTDTSDPGDLTSTASFLVTVSVAPASQVVITSPGLDLPTGSLGQITLSLEDQYGDQGALSSTDQTISLDTTSSGGAFYATQSSTTPITSIVIPAGTSDVSIYYFDTQPGTPMVTASDAALASTSHQQETITPAVPTQIAITSAPLDMFEGTSSPMTVALEAANGSSTTSSVNQTISLRTTSPGGAFYATATSTASITSVEILAGSSTATFDYGDASAGTPTITADDVALGSAPTQRETVTGVASQVAFTSGALTLTAGMAGELTVALEDSSGNPARSASAQTIDLTSTSGKGAYYTSQSGTTPITSAVIAAGETSASVYYLDTKAGDPTLTASDTALNSSPAQTETVNPAAASVLVLQKPPSSTAITGEAFATQPVVYEVDQYGNLETSDDATIITASLATGVGPLEGKHTAELSRGIATFVGLADDKAESISLKFAAGSLSALSNSITVAAGPAIQLFVTTQPPSSLTAARAFSLVVSAEDQFKNVNLTYSGSVTVSLAGDPSFTTTVQAKDGVATFTGLQVTAVQSGEAIQISASGLTGTASNPLSVTSVAPPPPPPPPPPASAPAPTVVLERLTTSQKTKKGKPVGKPIFGGFSIQYSTAMNAATAGLSSDYQVVSNLIKKVKKKPTTTHKPVRFSVSYNPATDIVTISVKNSKPFAKGGEITILGVTSQAGVALNSSDTTLTILAGAKGITLA
jgi:ELWxxDGT repeat protein